MVVVAGCRDVPLRCGRRGLVIVASPGEHRRPRDIEGTHPGRSSCVRNAETPSGSGACCRAGKPTARKAQFIDGNRMTKKRMPAAGSCRRRKRSGKPRELGQPLQLVAVDNRPDTGTRARTRKRADVVR